MKKINFFIPILFALLISPNAFSQYEINEDLVVDFAFEKGNILLTKNNTEVKGTPYYNSKLYKGVVYMPNNKKTGILDLVLDLQEDRLIFKDNNTFKIFNPELIKGIKLINASESGDQFFTTGYTSPANDISKKTPLRVVYDGKTKLLVHYGLSYDRGNFRDPITNRIYSEYKVNEKYYLVTSEGVFKKTKIKLKNIINDLGEYKKEIKDFAKHNNIKGKSEEDIQKILQFYDAIREENSQSL